MVDVDIIEPKKRGRPSTGFNRKEYARKYYREYMRKRRAEGKGGYQRKTSNPKYKGRPRMPDELPESILSESHFHNESAAFARLEAIVWPQGPHCPKCGGFDRITDVKGGRMGLRRCGPCKREFTVKVGTIFEDSKVRLHIWFQAAHLMASSKKGISAHHLYQTLGITYKSTWFMEKRIRSAC